VCVCVCVCVCKHMTVIRHMNSYFFNYFPYFVSFSDSSKLRSFLEVRIVFHRYTKQQ